LIARSSASAKEITAIEPAIAPDFACGAFHGGWYFVRNPHRVVTSIAKNVTASGGEIVQDEIRRIVHDGARATSLVLASGERRVDHLVICAGAYSGQLTAQLDERVLLEAERGYHLTIPNPGFDLGRTITYAKTPIAMTPMEMGLRLAGSDEFAGLDAPPNWRRANVHWSFAKRVFPALRPLDETVTRWMGRRPGTPDGLPVIGPSRKLANVWYGFGHSHMGLAWGPTTGRLIAEQMGGHKSNIDLAPFRVDRF
jgi:D-amino-acid dehydrogenase